MNRPRAWLAQARSDAECGRLLLGHADPTLRCHSVAKFQQAAEKAIKALSFTLEDRLGWRIAVRRDHKVSPLVSAMVHVPRGPKYQKDVQLNIYRLFDQVVRGRLCLLDALAPSWPAAGSTHPRNTEYPFEAAGDGWLPPCDPSAFTRAEVDSFDQCAGRIVTGCSRLISGLYHGTT